MVPVSKVVARFAALRVTWWSMLRSEEVAAALSRLRAPLYRRHCLEPLVQRAILVRRWATAVLRRCLTARADRPLMTVTSYAVGVSTARVMGLMMPGSMPRWLTGSRTGRSVVG